MSNKNASDEITFYFFSDKTSQHVQDTFREMSRQWGFTLNIIEVSDELFKDLPPWFGSWGTYFRVLVDRLIPQSVDKVLYLDCDMIATTSLAPLYETDLSDKYAAVVVDCLQTARKKSFGYPYFNAGMILFNLKLYREDNIAEKALQYGHAHHALDQDMLNAVFQGNVVYLPFKWNAMEMHTSRLKPGEIGAILHFTWRRPWRVGCFHRQRKLYWKYLSQTPFYGQIRREYYKWMLLNPDRLWSWFFWCRFNRNMKVLRLFGITILERYTYDVDD